ncbi:hypothetical protein [Bacillus altitudinis]|uniref:hypothetical protein n=1 Tax=Bacillus altitudinis TaxID=293387 RepID=UPI0011A30D81|nr:hypothetical protein [Bacillus altitudinis]
MKKMMVSYLGEGLVGKKKMSKWEEDRGWKEWVKMKNWGYVCVMVSGFDKENGYFEGCVYEERNVLEVVEFKDGFCKEEEQRVGRLFVRKGEMSGG